MLAREEQETVIRFDEVTGNAYLYTSSRRVAKKLFAEGFMPFRVEKVNGVEIAWHFDVLKDMVRIQIGRKSIKIGGTKPTGGEPPQITRSETKKNRSESGENESLMELYQPSLFGQAMEA